MVWQKQPKRLPVCQKSAFGSYFCNKTHIRVVKLTKLVEIYSIFDRHLFDIEKIYCIIVSNCKKFMLLKVSFGGVLCTKK